MNTEQTLFIHFVATCNHLYGLNEEIRLTIAAQMALESNYGKSKIAKENCNLCGMKLAKVRPTTAIGENRGHAVYYKLNDCIKDYTIWLYWMQPTKYDLVNTENYLNFLKRKQYAEDQHYTEKIKQILNDYGQQH